MLRSDRHDNRPHSVGGGVAIYIKEGFVYEQYSLVDEVDPGIEHVCIVMKMKGMRLGLCVVYRPPTLGYTCIATLFNSLFVNLAIETKSVICIGDLNIDLSSKTCYKANYLRRLLKESNVTQIINEPTRITNNSATLIDHIIVDRSAEIEMVGVIDASSLKDYKGRCITDHKLVYCTVTCRKEKEGPQLICYRDYSKFNIHKAIDQFSKVDWNSIKQIEDLNDIESFITSNIRKVYDEEAPIVCRRVTKGRTPWRNKEIIQLTKVKNKLRNKYRKTMKDNDWNNYKRARNMLNVLVCKAKKTYFSEKLSACDHSKEFWSCLKQCGVVGDSKINEILPNMSLNEINKFFVEMGHGSDVNEDILHFFKTHKRDDVLDDFSFVSVNEEEVKLIMNTIKSKAVGCDNISIDMIKSVSPYAIGAITHLINQSLIKGEFPKKWKTSLVKPLPKVTKPKTIQQLRPISILPAMSKILEKVVFRQIESYLNQKNILPKLQSGFRSNYSTCTALVNLFADLYDAKDMGRYSLLTMLDYSQAFDSISHKMLTAKMNYYGFDENVISWVNSYLNPRLQVTKVGNKTSLPLHKRRGVPQGSCLGPILFNIYTSDLISCVQNCTVHLYADDCQLHISYKPENITNAVAAVNSDLNSILTWSVNNGLKLNISKCSVLHIPSQRLSQSLSESGVGVMLDGQELAVLDKIKTLGVLLDKDLTFSDHITHSIRRSVGKLKGLYRFRDLLPESAKLQLMQSLILSVFYYCYPAYGNSISRGDTERIQKMQNTAIRFIYNLSRSDHVSLYRDAAHLLPMDTFCRMMTSCMMHKVLSLKEPQYLSERLLYREEVAERSTRQRGRLHFPKIRLEVGRKSFSYFGPRLYNDIPDHIKSMPSSKTFKTNLRKMLYN